MSSIGRIFIVLNLFASALFLGWAVKALKTEENYRTKMEADYGTAQERVKTLDTQVADLSAKFQLADGSVKRLTAERDAEKERADSLTNQLADSKRSEQQLTAQLTEIREGLKDYNTQLGTLTASKDRAVEDARNAERAAEEAKATAAEAEIAMRDAQDLARQQEARAAELETTLATTKDQLTSRENEIETIVSTTGISKADFTAVPQIDAAILDAKLDVNPGLVILNVGAEQKVTRGMTFDVYRGGTYKGQVRVENVQPKQASALVIRPVKGQKIAQGDSATTRI